MIHITDKTQCCGCGACEQICPKHCIKMIVDEEGFWYPKVNETECTKCGLCERVCPVLNAKQINCNDVSKIHTYLAYITDTDLRMKSSSGGMFTLLAEQVLSEGGVVFGAAFDEKFLVHHIKVEDRDGLSALRGSKYLQSRIEHCYRETKEELLAGRKVLFTGTACQIAGLYGYLGKDHENLITVDVLCHGVPSPAVWRRYLDEQEALYGAAVRRTFFRSKNSGWKTFALLLEFSNNKAYESILSKDRFMQMFLRNICLRPSCHNCKFKGMDRPSDISIGDAWGVEKHSPEMDDNRGTSVVLLHTSKGIQLFDKLRADLICKVRDLDTALPPRSDSRKSVTPHYNRKKFFQKFTRGFPTTKLVKLTNPTLLRRVLRKGKRIVKKI